LKADCRNWERQDVVGLSLKQLPSVEYTIVWGSQYGNIEVGDKIGWMNGWVDGIG